MGTSVEAVIITGERKGDLIELSDEKVDMVQLRDMLQVAAGAANEMAAEAKALRKQTESFVKKVTSRRGKMRSEHSLKLSSSQSMSWRDIASHSVSWRTSSIGLRLD